MKTSKIKFGSLRAKAAAIVASTTTVLSHADAVADNTVSSLTWSNLLVNEKSRNRLIPKLVLKLNIGYPDKSKIVSHSSHSSHESHSSHAPHGSGYSGSGGSGSFVGPLLFVGV